ncbi:hypothetical protein QCA50_004869 [Cerrena zonata]|uniref:Uncharacterized protein n=1 Tax=Cerrena zonata TaxID=2478898 RepID=A0AAW0GDT3_9APHY
MSSKAPSNSSSTASKNSIAPGHMIALPSLSSSLSSLPQAKSVDAVALHPFPMSAQRSAESEAKLRKVLSHSNSNASHASAPAAYATAAPSYSPGSGDPPLMMRKPLKSKIQA